jgi:hypothetical protein
LGAMTFSPPLEGRLVEDQDRNQRRASRSRCARHRAHPSPEDPHGRCTRGPRNATSQSREERKARRPCLSVRLEGQGDQCRQHPQTVHRAGSGKAEARQSELALPTNLLRDVDGSGRGRPKSVQGQMRHTRISTTMDTYAQFVSAGQRRAATKLTDYVEQESKRVPLVFQ